MIIPTRGNILTADAEALVNPVNCVGVMGKGLALQFREAFPRNYLSYKADCATGDVRLGEVSVFERAGRTPRYIINFPTKKHWRDKSRVRDIEAGLVDLVEHVEMLGIRSVAVPALGCGLGGLTWEKVRPLIEQAFAGVPDVRVLLFPPEEV